MYMDTYGLDQVSLLGATESALRKCWKKVGPLGIPSENKLFPKWKPALQRQWPKRFQKAPKLEPVLKQDHGANKDGLHKMDQSQLS